MDGRNAKPRSMKRSHLLATGLVLLGIALHAHIGLVKSTSISLPLLLWSISPYVIGGLLVAAGPSHVFVGALALVCMADLLLFRSIFTYPTSSTAPIALIFMPMWNIVVIGPIGALLGWLFAWLVRRKA